MITLNQWRKKIQTERSLTKQRQIVERKHDVRLGDVLIHGNRIKYIKSQGPQTNRNHLRSSQNKRIKTQHKPKLQGDLDEQQNIHQPFLFRNAQIKSRLKSLDSNDHRDRYQDLNKRFLQEMKIEEQNKTEYSVAKFLSKKAHETKRNLLKAQAQKYAQSLTINQIKSIFSKYHNNSMPQSHHQLNKRQANNNKKYAITKINEFRIEKSNLIRFQNKLTASELMNKDRMNQNQEISQENKRKSCIIYTDKQKKYAQEKNNRYGSSKTIQHSDKTSKKPKICQSFKNKITICGSHVLPIHFLTQRGQSKIIPWQSQN